MRRCRQDRFSSQQGLTLVELIVTSGIVAIIALAISALISVSLAAHESGTQRAALYREGLQVMERVTDAVRRSTWVAIPNGQAPVRDLLAVSGFINDDDDYYFDDPLFPRIDEDPRKNMNDDGFPGLRGIDDDLDGQVDEVVGSSPIDDDEDSSSDEDPVDRLDNDMDGSIDEDPSADINGDGYSGIKGLDDDGDGLVDEHGFRDDDEDGMINEDGTNEIIFWVPSGTTLRQDDHLGAIQHILSERVTFFQATQVTSQQILVEITLTAENGETVRFAEQVCPRNVLQTCGKRVR